jgi:hypothetical protein
VASGHVAYGAVYCIYLKFHLPVRPSWWGGGANEEISPALSEIMGSGESAVNQLVKIFPAFYAAPLQCS